MRLKAAPQAERAAVKLAALSMFLLFLLVLALTPGEPGEPTEPTPVLELEAEYLERGWDVYELEADVRREAR